MRRGTPLEGSKQTRRRADKLWYVLESDDCDVGGVKPFEAGLEGVEAFDDLLRSLVQAGRRVKDAWAQAVEQALEANNTVAARPADLSVHAEHEPGNVHVEIGKEGLIFQTVDKQVYRGVESGFIATCRGAA